MEMTAQLKRQRGSARAKGQEIPSFGGYPPEASTMERMLMLNRPKISLCPTRHRPQMLGLCLSDKVSTVKYEVTNSLRGQASLERGQLL
jgi:hypothetical protein